MSSVDNSEELIAASKRYEDVTLSAEYVKSRIRYPASVFKTVMALSTTQIPLSCGRSVWTGLMSTVFLAPYFDKVLGVDISESQIEQATLQNQHLNIDYKVSAGESLSVEDNSVTLIQVATALHWLDHESSTENVTEFWFLEELLLPLRTSLTLK
ncbi:hypothetical protein EB796_008145 [Bugula neritina]|uniref:Methyltransferase domain-containing protein n=1 Tax=Bugula neritina TaxID=10212 RepID=A0A7J7K4J0_BUGNE|nr:hypothetical protein EB796_008145 [Bugula neritina]